MGCNRYVPTSLWLINNMGRLVTAYFITMTFYAELGCSAVSFTDIGENF
jgi:hypothetical protein